MINLKKSSLCDASLKGMIPAISPNKIIPTANISQERAE